MPSGFTSGAPLPYLPSCRFGTYDLRNSPWQRHLRLQPLLLSLVAARATLVAVPAAPNCRVKLPNSSSSSKSKHRSSSRYLPLAPGAVSSNVANVAARFNKDSGNNSSSRSSQGNSAGPAPAHPPSWANFYNPWTGAIYTWLGPRAPTPPRPSMLHKPQP